MFRIRAMPIALPMTFFVLYVAHTTKNSTILTFIVLIMILALQDFQCCCPIFREVRARSSRGTGQGDHGSTFYVYIGIFKEVMARSSRGTGQGD